ncbi:hypothetical protein [Acuticoccus sediminis]|uniref:hypothetical protein n=1 Tax=Acuticoccus sediminis TaxID=2184697 RepID=UPI001CFE47F0|nr:hypothetical protein [Acuticoccus sediminis]
MTNYVTFAGHRVLTNSVCIICKHIFSRESAPKLILHEEDGTFQVTCGNGHFDAADFNVVGFGHISDVLPNSDELAYLPIGHEAEEVRDGVWDVKIISTDDEN